MPGLSHGEALLAKAVKELRMSWDQTASSWRDQARAEFEKTYLDELLPAARSAAGAIERMNDLLADAMGECS